jgi:hypothetical protein
LSIVSLPFTAARALFRGRETKKPLSKGSRDLRESIWSSGVADCDPSLGRATHRWLSKVIGKNQASVARADFALFFRGAKDRWETGAPRIAGNSSGKVAKIHADCQPLGQVADSSTGGVDRRRSRVAGFGPKRRSASPATHAGQGASAVARGENHTASGRYKLLTGEFHITVILFSASGIFFCEAYVWLRGAVVRAVLDIWRIIA